MRDTVTRNFVPALLALIVFLVTLPFVESAIRIYDQNQNAITWHGGRAVTPVVKPGEVLSIEYRATVNKQCPADIRGFIVAPDGTVPVRMPIAAGGYTRPSDGPITIPVKITVPATSDPGLAPLSSGEYIYRALTTRYCRDGVEEDILVPDVKFMLDVPEHMSGGR